MQHIFTCRIGHDLGTQTNALSPRTILETAENVLSFNGCTTWEANGYWRGNYEQTTVIEIAGLTKAEAQALSDKLPELSEALGQTSIYGTITEANCAERFASEYTAQSMTA